MTITKKTMANMRNSSKKLAKLEGVHEMISAFTENVNEVNEQTGESRVVSKGYIEIEDGQYYGTISPTAIRCIEDAIDILEDGENVQFRVETRTSNGGRDYISLVLI